MDRTIVAAAVLLALGGCAPPDRPEDPAYAWTCNGKSFAVRLTTQGNAEISAGGKTYRLAAVMAASGARYADEKVEFWEHGGEAMLNGAEGGPYEDCTRDDPT